MSLVASLHSFCEDKYSNLLNNIRTDNSYCESVEEFKYLGTNLTNQNSIKEEINADRTHGMLAIIQCSIFCLPFCYPKMQIIRIKIYRTIILPVVYGCETWSLTLREERRLRVYENRVLKRIFGPKKDEVTREWRKLHNEELKDLYTLLNIVRVIKWRRIIWAGMWHVWGRGDISTGFGGNT
jgi:hypothetical protein